VLEAGGNVVTGCGIERVQERGSSLRLLIGPTALLTGARDAYALGRVRREDLLDTLAWPGSWRMLHRLWHTGLTELSHTTLRSILIRAAARYVPELRAEDV
jgi:L-2-hydroxyglutarate oxidase